MSRRDAVCEMDLIRGRGFLGESGSLFPPFSISSSNFSSDRSFSAKPCSPYIDFSRVKELNDAIQLFHKMKSMQRKPTIPMYNNLLSVTVTIEQYPLALDVFDEMPRMSVPVDVYLMSIAVNCCYRLKDVNCGFALVCLFFKRGCEANVVTVSTLVKGPFSEDKVAEAVKLLKKVVVMVMEQLREEGEKLGNGEVKKENFADLMKGEGGYGDQNVGVEKASVVGLKVAEEAKDRESLRKLHEIVAASDEIMIARGDLGVEIPLEQIPTVQEEIIYICRQLNKPVMVASQLLESMVEYPTPTRPEVADVSEAFRQYADALMLSGESAIGPFGQKARSVLRMTSSRMELWSREENRQNIVLLHNLTASLPDQIAEQICNSAAAMAA